MKRGLCFTLTSALTLTEKQERKEKETIVKHSIQSHSPAFRHRLFPLFANIPQDKRTGRHQLDQHLTHEGKDECMRENMSLKRKCELHLGPFSCPPLQQGRERVIRFVPWERRASGVLANDRWTTS